MHLMNRRFASHFFVTTAFCVVIGLVDQKLGCSQQFENPDFAAERGRPDPVSLSNTDESRSSMAPQHSILFDETASQTPALDVPPQTATMQVPMAGSRVADDPFDSTAGIRRVEGTGEESLGTFATSDNMPLTNQGTNQNLSDEARPGFRGQQQLMPQEDQPSSLPPITSNGLRGALPEPRMMVPSGDVPTTRFGDDQTGDEQPEPPQADRNPPAVGSFGQDRGSRLQPTVSEFGNNRFVGPPDSAPPIHNAPASQWNDNAESTPQLSTGQTIFDSNIRPTQFQQSVNDNDTRQPLPVEKIDWSLARKIMTRYEIASAPDPLPGRPLKLVEVLETTPRHLQKKVINQYWETFFDWATVLNSAQLTDWLNQLPPPQNQSDAALLNAARAAARNRMLADEIKLGNSQCKLQQLMGSRDDLLPLPSDLPLLQSYDSHYDWYESRKRLPEDLRGIDVMISKSIQLISNRANTVGTTRVALSQIRNYYNQNPRDLGQILVAARLWNEAEQDLVWSIVNYNQTIADYSLTISPGSTRPDQIVAMLIATPKSATAQTDALPAAGRTNIATERNGGDRPNSTPFQNVGQQRFQDSSRSPSQFNQSTLPGQNGSGPDVGDDSANRMINQGSSLSPSGFPGNRSPAPPSIENQSVRPPAQPGTFQNPRFAPPNQSQPNSFQPNSIQPNSTQPAVNPGDRSAFRGNNATSFGDPSRSSFAPPSTRGMSESAKEFNSFGR
jgi:hypothetical protein